MNGKNKSSLTNVANTHTHYAGGIFFVFGFFEEDGKINEKRFFISLALLSSQKHIHDFPHYLSGVF